jgi:hypothetical protein
LVKLVCSDGGIELPMSFSSNGTSSLCNEVEGEVLGSSPIGCVRNLPIKKKKKKKSDGEIERIYEAYNVLIELLLCGGQQFFFFLRQLN